MNTDGTGFNTRKECHKTESLWNRTTTDHKEGEQLEDRRNVGESSCNFGDGTDQRVQSLMFMMMMILRYVPGIFWRHWENVAKYLEPRTRFEPSAVRTQVRTATKGPNWVGLMNNTDFHLTDSWSCFTDVTTYSPAVYRYLKCLLLAASRRAANQHQESPSAPIHFHAELICTAVELLVLVYGSNADSTAPLTIRSHHTTSEN